MTETFANVDDYISSLPENVQTILGEVRRVIRDAAPAADETISYRMPTFILGGRSLVYFAAWKHHVSVYPVPAVDEALERELAPYRAAKATLRFPIRQPIPYDLIQRLVVFLVRRRLKGVE
jgi:uncharacterized protein YdhG (YjbR/CyaY superfamily)